MNKKNTFVFLAGWFLSIGFLMNATYCEAQACTGLPSPGNTLSSTPLACPGTPFTLSIQNVAGLGTGISFQWYSSSMAIAGATNATYTTLITAGSITYYCEVTCLSSGLSANTNPITLSASIFGCYCYSSAISTLDEEIYNVTLNGNSTNSIYSFTNGCTTVAPGPGSILSKYSSFLSLPPLANLIIGVPSSLTIQQDECDGPTYFPNRIGVWIDFNQNASFTDPGENVFLETSATLGPKTITGIITPPVSALIGNTIMRVVCKEGSSIPSPCGNYTAGETEDYLIGISATPPPTPCVGTPNPGNTVASSISICSGGACTFSLQNIITPSFGITYQWYNGSGPILAATSSTYTTSLTASDSFYCKVTCTASGLLTLSTPVTVQVLPPIINSSSVSACDNYLWNGSLLNSSGIYTATFITALGCDSIHTLQLTILQSSSTNVTLSDCDSVMYNGIAYSGSGNYLQTFTNMVGCDSNVHIQVTIDTLNVMINLSGATLATTNVGNFHWLDCSTNTIIPGATNNSFTPIVAGTYALIVTNLSLTCIDTSNCLLVIPTSIESLFNHPEVSIYPNPVQTIFEINVNDSGELSIYNSIGKMILQKRLMKGKNSIDLSSYATGVYFLRVKMNGEVFSSKLLRE